MFIENYNPVFPDGTKELLKADNYKELSIFVIAVIPEKVKDITVNLKSPIVINFEKKHGAQIILENREYSVKTRLFASESNSCEGTV